MTTGTTDVEEHEETQGWGAEGNAAGTFRWHRSHLQKSDM